MKTAVWLSVVCTFAVNANQIYPGKEQPLSSELSSVDSTMEIFELEKAYYEGRGALIAQRVLSANPEVLTVKEGEKAFLTDVLPFSRYMNESLYNPQWGYYGSGRVQFGMSYDDFKDFCTFPNSLSPLFGSMVAYQLYGIWRSMVLSGDLTEDEPFFIIEFGAGVGILARDILTAISQYALREEQEGWQSHWRTLYAAVQYIIGEYAPALHLQQAVTNSQFIEAGKLRLVLSDARSMQNIVEKPVKGVVLSNELLDAFSLEKVEMKKNGSCTVRVYVPLFNCNRGKELSIGDENVLKEHHQMYQANHAAFLNEKLRKEDEIYLSADDYLLLKNRISLTEQYKVDACIRFIEQDVSVELFPEVKKYLIQHAFYFSALQNQLKGRSGCALYVNTGIKAFLREAASLLDVGFVLSIDYGGSSVVHNCSGAPYTTLGVYPKYYLHCTAPGAYDITANINFTHVALEGSDAGLEPIFWGVQAILNESAYMLTHECMLNRFDEKNTTFVENPTSYSSKSFQSFKDALGFKEFLQKKKGTKSCFRPIKSSNNLFRFLTIDPR